MNTVICIPLLAKMSRRSKDQIIATPSSHQHTTISNLTNCLQVVVMDLKKTAAMKNPDLTPRKPIVLTGDSIIKHIDPKKLSQRRGHKFSYPGKTAGAIAEVVDSIAVSSDLSHVINHTGTNNLQLNLPSDLLNHVSQKSRTLQ